jgi:hypothetical protein
MDVPDHVRALRKDVLQREGGRRDDVEFTFVKGTSSNQHTTLLIDIWIG